MSISSPRIDFLIMTLKWESHRNSYKFSEKSSLGIKNLISRWVLVIISYKFFSSSKMLRKKFFHQNFLIKKFSSSDIWIDVFKNWGGELKKYGLFFEFLCFKQCTRLIAFEHTNLQCLTPSTSWDIWIDVRVRFGWFQPYDHA